MRASTTILLRLAAAACALSCTLLRASQAEVLPIGAKAVKNGQFENGQFNEILHQFNADKRRHAQLRPNGEEVGLAYMKGWYNGKKTVVVCTTRQQVIRNEMTIQTLLASPSAERSTEENTGMWIFAGTEELPVENGGVHCYSKLMMNEPNLLEFAASLDVHSKGPALLHILRKLVSGELLAAVSGPAVRSLARSLTPLPSSSLAVMAINEDGYMVGGIHPENIHIDASLGVKRPWVYITNFSYMTWLDAEGGAARLGDNYPKEMAKYRPPEAFTKPVSSGLLQDLWAVGASIYRVLKGRAPFETGINAHPGNGISLNLRMYMLNIRSEKQLKISMPADARASSGSWKELVDMTNHLIAPNYVKRMEACSKLLNVL
ncbi:hypothetical protein SYNPS1DRAFT_27139 [Syncephalis pseudoplumigaleata]|uniref:Protein kinase domain-containing protein n=1 Tax=Syncephalis pseudoplumigaleata TaxID=1712513 RepID=A0A4P9Z5W6_9FUNG|nr:hypothetical protein SYNPS1DRAFT_27139 [Syncephalis pseudoplumigaleata]|eukprot:RKP27201.1 hypothetical protein SYNPS1DRAFT_27139 [Syncephalis pseudoplumigaleata]